MADAEMGRLRMSRGSGAARGSSALIDGGAAAGLDGLLARLEELKGESRWAFFVVCLYGRVCGLRVMCV